MSQHNKIQASFEHSIFLKPHKYKGPFYKNLQGYVSEKALHFISKERERYYGFSCGCALRTSHGLPCACRLASYKCVPLNSIHPFWKRLTWEAVDPNEDPDELNLTTEIAAILVRFGQMSHLQKRAMK